MNRRIAAALFGAIVALFALPACTTVQETGRKQFNIVSDDQAASMGVEAFSSIKKQEKISTDPAMNARIQRIGKRIAAAVGRDLPNAQWEFVVFESDQINAFALPGGKVGVYTALIKLADSDDEIAVVMGHEVAHVSSRHGSERQSQAMLVGLGGAALAIGTEKDKNQQYYMLAYGLTSTLGTLKYSRDHEREADAVGLQFAARAGYDPRAAASFWRKMAAKETGGRPPAWLSTHPPSEERIETLERLAPGLMPVYQQAKANLAAGGAPARATAAPAAPATSGTASGAKATKAASATEQQELDKFLGR